MRSFFISNLLLESFLSLDLLAFDFVRAEGLDELLGDFLFIGLKGVQVAAVAQLELSDGLVGLRVLNVHHWGSAICLLWALSVLNELLSVEELLRLN
jgi:hypothetical protein